MVLTQEGTEDLDRTRLLVVDTVNGSTAEPIDVPGQLTAPVPTAQGIVAADAGAVVRVAGDGTRTVLAPAKGVPYRLAADADGGVVFIQNDNDTSPSVSLATKKEFALSIAPHPVRPAATSRARPCPPATRTTRPTVTGAPARCRATIRGTRPCSPSHGRWNGR